MSAAFEFETPLLRAFNWLVRTDPAAEVRLEASRPDQLWWDIWGYGDIPSRQVEAFLFLRKMTGITAAGEIEQGRRDHLFSSVHEDGLTYRPGSSLEKRGGSASTSCWTGIRAQCR
ncbi:MAG: hypothetical protein HYU36_11785 [Planctomycetes bacterium]|nr:hypothetical protein [Planctomycetota bacterium]